MASHARWTALALEQLMDSAVLQEQKSRHFIHYCLIRLARSVEQVYTRTCRAARAVVAVIVPIMPRKRKIVDDEFDLDPIDPEERMLRFRIAMARLRETDELDDFDDTSVGKENIRPRWAGPPSKYDRVVDPEMKLLWRERDRRAKVARRLAHARRQLATAQASLQQSPEDEKAKRRVRAAAGRIAGLTRSMKMYTRDMVAAAHKTNTSLDRYERQVDPEGMMDPLERRKKALAARRRYYKKIGKLGQKAKQRKQRAKEVAPRRRLARANMGE
jgi:hypothetical protein